MDVGKNRRSGKEDRRSSNVSDIFLPMKSTEDLLSFHTAESGLPSLRFHSLQGLSVPLRAG